MDTNATGRFIADLRRQKGYTQKQLAEKLMVTDKAISRWETGKGLPDTSLLKPLGDILGVSVSELLSGKIIEDEKMKDQSDKIILESLNYSKRMFGSTVGVILFIIGIALIVSPLFSASQNYAWILGIAIAAAAIFCTYMRKKEYSMRAKNKVYYLAAIMFQCAALILEILPIGAVMVFAAGPNQRITEIYSYFSLLPLGYENVTPMLTGILTVVIMVLGVISVFKFDIASKLKKAVFICSVLSFLFSIIPLFLFGKIGMTAASYTISGAIFLSICMQAAANRKE